MSLFFFQQKLILNYSVQRPLWLLIFLFVKEQHSTNIDDINGKN